MVKVKEDMTGWIMSEHGLSNSRLTVICQADDYIDPSGRHKAQWLCQCNCGSKPKVIGQYDLKHGKILSCGCLHSDAMNQFNQSKRKYNYYNLGGTYGIGYTSNTGREFYFDLEDYDKIRDYCWSEVVDDTGYHYLSTAIIHSDGTHTSLRMYKLFVNYSLCDHKDRNPFNNCKSNLRNVSGSQNAQNRSLRKDNTSGIIGVSWDTKRAIWGVRLVLHGKGVYHQDFSNKNDAIIARLCAELKYFGLDFAPQRHLFEQYGIMSPGDKEASI